MLLHRSCRRHSNYQIPITENKFLLLRPNTNYQYKTLPIPYYQYLYSATPPACFCIAVADDIQITKFKLPKTNSNYQNQIPITNKRFWFKLPITNTCTLPLHQHASALLLPTTSRRTVSPSPHSSQSPGTEQMGEYQVRSVIRNKGYLEIQN